MRLSAFFAGIALAFAVPITLTLLLGEESWLFVPLMVVSYGIVGSVLGYRWPEGGWRLGLWLFAFWLLLIPLSFIFSDPIPLNFWRELQNLIWHALIGIAACFGAGLGALLRQS